jgi:hypothetical protein
MKILPMGDEMLYADGHTDSRKLAEKTENIKIQVSSTLC